MRQAGLRVARCDYVLFLPRILREIWPRLEALLRGLPLGAQYWVAARKIA